MYSHRDKKEGQDKGQGGKGCSGGRAVDVGRGAVNAISVGEEHKDTLSSMHNMVTRMDDV